MNLLRRIASRFSIEEIVGQEYAVGVTLINDLLGRDLFFAFGKRALVINLS